MTEDELERRLHAHYRGIDPKVAPSGLALRIGDGLDRRPGRGGVARGFRPVYAALAAAVLIVAVGLGLGLRPAVTTSPPPSLASPSVSTTPASSPPPSLATPLGSVPPVTTGPWTTMRLEAVPGGPVRAESVVAWSGGYLALGQTGSRGNLPAWISRDGRDWVRLPAGTFGPASFAAAAPCGDAVLVAVTDENGASTIWRSTDGSTWTSTSSPALRLARRSDLAGGPSGAIAVLEGFPYRLAFSPDGVTWQIVSLPGGSFVDAQGVAAFGTGFVAVGDGGLRPRTTAPFAWWSADGLHWSRATVQAGVDGGFDDVRGGGGGLVAFSTTGGAPGRASFWTSRDGRTWTTSTADPLGIWKGGAGEGSANGLFQGDGTRLLGYGMRSPGASSEYWVSLDATHWTKLALSGDAAAAAAAGQVTPFLMRDGVLFVGDQGSWFGSPVP
jgi:hypothetical protein